MAILKAKSGWRLPCLNILRFGRSPKTWWRSYTASTDATVGVKSESESGTEKPVIPYKLRKGARASWTPEEISLVQKLADDGLSHHAIPSRLSGRSYSAVASILYYRSSGAPVAQGRRSWTPQETQKLLSLSESGASVREIAKQFAPRTVASVHTKLKRSKSSACRSGPHDNSGQARRRGRHWTGEEIARLHSLAKEGLSMAQVAQKMNRTLPAVDKRWRQTRAMGEIWPSFSVWTPQDEAELVRMRKAGSSLDEIAKALHRSELGCKQRWKITRPRHADGTSIKFDDLGPHLSDAEFHHIVHMRRPGTSWQDIQESRWPAFTPAKVRRAFQKACSDRISEHRSRSQEKHAARRELSDDEWILIRRLRDDGDLWATISCTIDPETPRLTLENTVRKKFGHAFRRNSSFGEAAGADGNANASCGLSSYQHEVEAHAIGHIYVA